MKNPKESFIQYYLETRHPNSPKDPPRYSNALEVFEVTRKRHEQQADEHPCLPIPDKTIRIIKGRNA